MISQVHCPTWPDKMPTQHRLKELSFSLPQSHGMHPGFVGPLTPLVMLEVDEVDEGGISRFEVPGRNESVWGSVTSAM